MKTIDRNHPTVQKWTERTKIISTVWSESEANLRVVTNEITRTGKLTNDYALLRFFYLGDEVEVSVDIKACPMDEFLKMVFEDFGPK